MLLIHAPPAPRVTYALRLVFERLIPVPFEITQDAGPLATHDGPVLAYGDHPPEAGVPFVRAVGLLLESGVRQQTPSPFPFEDTLALFPTEPEASLLPYDPFAAAFYHVCRYEEYLADDFDQHGRVRPEASVLFRDGWLRQPVVNQYAGQLRIALQRHYPRFEWGKPTASAESTIDIDVAYAFRGRRVWESLAGAGRDLIRSPLRFVERARVLSGRVPDPYDTFDWLGEVHAAHGVPLRYFMLMSRGRGVDRGLSPDGPHMQQLVARVAQHARVGLHPSYASAEHPALIQEERARLERLLGRAPQSSRQHFLRLDIPQTYRALAAAGIRHDYTMGYASEPGFRAGTATPFPFFDAERDEQLPITIHPLVYMDGTLREYQRLEPEQAIATIDDLAEAVQEYGGQFVSLWHNSTVGDTGAWRGWKEVFVHSVRACSAISGTAAR